MLVDINLLPKREKESTSSVAVISIIVLFVFIASCWMYVTIHNLNKEIAKTEKQLVAAKVQEMQQQKKEKTNSTSQASTKLAQEIQTTEAKQMKTVPLLKTMTSFLPERGVFQTFSYKDPGTLVLEVRFDEKRDAAYFYKRLQDERWVKDAQLSFLKAIEIQDQQGNVVGMPRYLAHYELTINKDKVKDLEKEDTR